MVPEISSSQIEFSLPKNYDPNTEPHPSSPIPAFLREGEDRIFPTLDQLLQVKVDDESLRDGLQGVRHRYPSPEEAIEYLGLVDQVGIDILTAGIATSREAPPYKVTRTLLPHMRDHYPHITPIFIIRPVEYDRNMAEEMVDIHPHTEVLIYQAAAPIRVWVEDWETNQVLQDIAETVKHFRNRQIPIPTIPVLEDSTRTPPEILDRFIKMVIDSGTDRICIAETTGNLHPIGAFRTFRFFRERIAAHSQGKPIGLDAHCHNDRAWGLMNVSIAVAQGGADRIHGVWYGVGERAGNTPLEQVLYEFNRSAREAGYPENLWRIDKMREAAQYFSKISGVPIPEHAPLIGENIDSTGAGPHANAYLEIEEKLKQLNLEDPKEAAYAKQLEELRNTIYTGVNLADLGRKPRFYIGPMSGRANVIQTLRELGYDVAGIDKNHPLVAQLLTLAHQNWRALTPEEIHANVGAAIPLISNAEK